jgi:hypothetical protein
MEVFYNLFLHHTELHKWVAEGSTPPVEPGYSPMNDTVLNQHYKAFMTHMMHMCENKPSHTPTYYLFFSSFLNNCHVSTFRNLAVVRPPVSSSRLPLLENMWNNIFVNDETKEEVLHMFCRLQRLYRGWSRFAQLWRRRRARLVIDHDLYMTPLSRDSPQVFTVYQDGNLYLFSLHDLMKIIQNAICNTQHFYSHILPCRNPYNNCEFNKSTLYNIFFAMLFRQFVIPKVFLCFFQCNFDLFVFKNEHEYEIREYAIANYHRGCSLHYLNQEVREMISYYNSYKIRERRIRIHRDFPAQQLVNIMMPYYKLFLSYQYSIGLAKRRYRKNHLLCKMDMFYNYNRYFGRKYVQRKNKLFGMFEENQNEVTYNDKHILFTADEKTIDFRSSHRLMLDRNYDIYSHLMVGVDDRTRLPRTPQAIFREGPGENHGGSDTATHYMEEEDGGSLGSESTRESEANQQQQQQQGEGQEQEEGEEGEWEEEEVATATTAVRPDIPLLVLPLRNQVSTSNLTIHSVPTSAFTTPPALRRYN